MDHTRGRGRRTVRSDADATGRSRFVPAEAVFQYYAALALERKRKEFEEQDLEKATELKPEKVDLHLKANRKDHHTDEYAINDLIIRRGQQFKVSVILDRPFDHENDALSFQLTVGSGDLPQESKQTLIRVKQTNHLSTSSWGLYIDRICGNTVALTVMSSADAAVGKYSIYVETKTKKKGSEDKYLTFRKKLDETLTLLFNAWCKDDPVYMENEEHRQEYVLNDHGMLWYGNRRNFNSFEWYFGQFEKVSLTSCLYLLENSNLSSLSYGNPILVSRAISKLANSTDEDGGVLEGNWSGEYEGGTNPCSWTGSVSILEEFATLKFQGSVKYGQCWVFSGIVTTLLRAIGIPTRSVTNFESAHDTDSSMTIDFHYNKEGEPLDYLNDSVWNFHVWNESFFTRPDLPGDYDGWQAFDATPQETSEGVFQCGPCPVKAIKAGDVYLPYDTKFIFGEVNGDRIYWEVDEYSNEFKVTRIDMSSIGKFISTKAAGKNLRDDLTNNYKYQDGSDAEKRVVRRAHQYSSKKHLDVYKDEPPVRNDVDFDFYQPDSVMTGSDVDVGFYAKNTSEDERTISYTMTITGTFYTGINVPALHRVTKNEVTLRGGFDMSKPFSLAASDYIGVIPSDARIKFVLKAKVKETGQEYCDIETLSFKKPTIQARLPEKLREKEEFDVTLFFQNPLPISLTNGKFKIDSSRHLAPDSMTRILSAPVEPKQEAACVVTLTADQGGKRDLNVGFASDQLSGACGNIKFDVEIKWDNSLGNILPGYL